MKSETDPASDAAKNGDLAREINHLKKKGYEFGDTPNADGFWVAAKNQ